ncbi:Sorting nexin-11 [Hondaea fermentalgiana]|uniref:Sorting nexin-11 n=1 Tax=Hondaea fermentalgiana TaxID=2315210 RepID=A0A2R5GBE6_9STRA|nr:Sorting nexin-11 [Hondaea fermentalgiana]|eukprot:GBG27659.1 Sorting nexin-11 [Hondaea fermentalgiana]
MSQPIRAVITGHELVNEHTEYKVELRAGAVKIASQRRRFRMFIELHAQLTKFKHAFPIPDVPPKKYFGNTNPEFVLKRQRELQAFLDKLVNGIVANPPSEAAWRLLCLFLGLDPKQYVPESILNLADQTAGGHHADGGVADGSATTAGNAAEGAAGGSSGAGPGEPGGSRSGSAAQTATGGPGSDTSQGAGYNGGSRQNSDIDAAQDPVSREVEEAKRMDRIVDNFARQTINVGRAAEERLQQASAALVERLPLDALREALEEHLLSQPLPAVSAASGGAGGRGTRYLAGANDADDASVDADGDEDEDDDEDGDEGEDEDEDEDGDDDDDDDDDDDAAEDEDGGNVGRTYGRADKTTGPAPILGAEDIVVHIVHT